MNKRKERKPRVVPSLQLRRQIQETYGDSTPPLDQIVDTFRAKYPGYKRHKRRFTIMVRQTLDSIKKKSSADTRLTINYDDETENENTSTSSHKRSKKYDSREQSAQESESESELESESEDRRSAVSGAEDDVVYGLQMEPEFDLTKSMLRNKYGGWSNLDGKTEETHLMDTDNNKAMGKVEANDDYDDDDDSNGIKEDKPTFEDFGGIDDLLNMLIKEVIIPLYHPEIPREIGVKPMTGILLHGPPGCGKTTLAKAIANETGFTFHETSGPALVSGVSGGSEENIRDLFSKAYKTAPSIICIDEIDAIASKRENHQREMEIRIVTQLMRCMDESRSSNKPGHVLVIGTTNRPDALDPALRRRGRFDREIALGVPDEKARFQILKARTRGMKFEGDVDLMKIARATPGFVGADLDGLVNEAGIAAGVRSANKRQLELFKLKSGEINKYWWKKPWSVEERKNVIRTIDFEVAMKKVEASSKREGFSDIPDVKWEDVGGLDDLRRVFNRYIVSRIKDPNVYEKNGFNKTPGFLLYGPPGCGKTLIAQAVANEAGANFIHIKGPELLSKYVGESELEVRKLFRRARTCSPCIVFFDEVDALTTNRGKEGGWVVERLVDQLLVELDQRKGVYVIGATNRPEAVDKALLRPGRMGKHLYVPLPNPDERGLILRAIARKMSLDTNVDLMAIGRSEACANFSGADLYALMEEAFTISLEEERSNKMEAAIATCDPEISLVVLPLAIKVIHFEQALREIRPSVSNKQKQYYDRLSDSFTTR